MLIQASVRNERGRHSVELSTESSSHTIAISPRSSGFGSRANGGELLCLAMATCYCNDVYREAEARGIEVVRVDVTACAEFGAPGAAAQKLRYRVRIAARAPEAATRALIQHTDSVAEVQNTLRRGIPVELEAFEAVAVGPE